MTFYRNTADKSPQLIKNIKHVNNLLLADNHDPKKQTVQSLVDFFKTKGFNNNTIINYMYTYTHINPHIKSSQFYKTITILKKNKSYIKYTKDEEEEIKRLCLFFIDEFLVNKTKDLGLCILLILATNLRISECLQLQKVDLSKILNKEKIHIKIKKRKNSTYIIGNKTLIHLILKNITHLKDDDLLLSKSKRYYNKTFKNQCLKPIPYLGMNSIRKLNTTLLIKNTTLDTATAFNRHTNTSITEEYYNNNTYLSEIINNTFKNI